MEACSRVDRATIERGLTEAGLRCEDVVLVHSSLRSFGHVVGGAEAVIDALLHVVGQRGTVVMPTFTWNRFHDKTAVVFDIAHEPSETGRIAEVFRRRPDAVRGEHVCHSVAAIGPQAEWIVGDGVSAWGEGSAFDRLYESDAWTLMLGVPLSVCTALHAAEERAAVPYRRYRSFSGSVVVRDDGRREPSRAVEFLPKPGFLCDFAKMRPVMDKAGVLQTTRIGDADVINVRIRDVIDIGLRCLERDIYFLLADECRPEQGGNSAR